MKLSMIAAVLLTDLMSSGYAAADDQYAVTFSVWVEVKEHPWRNGHELPTGLIGWKCSMAEGSIQSAAGSSQSAGVFCESASGGGVVIAVSCSPRNPGEVDFSIMMVADRFGHKVRVSLKCETGT